MAPEERKSGVAKSIRGLKRKDLMGIPWRVALGLQADGWYLRSDIVWEKPNVMPEPVKDRVSRCHEYLFMLTKSPKYYYDPDPLREPVTSKGGACFGKQKHATDGTGAQSRRLKSAAERNHPLGKNKRSVWRIPVRSFHGAHFAVFPPDLVRPCILAGCPPGGRVLDPFGGSGTTGLVARELGRDAILIELNPVYVEMQQTRLGVRSVLETTEHPLPPHPNGQAAPPATPKPSRDGQKLLWDDA